ncbi:MAG: hypothetical protein NXH97_05585 [Rhodobacteraceae bacterium]|nr:hypothetical protein [Paracoccaceae bacterium]
MFVLGWTPLKVCQARATVPNKNATLLPQGVLDLPHSDLPEGVHRVRRKTKSGDKYHFYAWRGGPKFWESAARSPRDPEFSVAFSKVVKPRLAGEYMTPQMVD